MSFYNIFKKSLASKMLKQKWNNVLSRDDKPTLDIFNIKGL